MGTQLRPVSEWKFSKVAQIAIKDGVLVFANRHEEWLSRNGLIVIVVREDASGETVDYVGCVLKGSGITLGERLAQLERGFANPDEPGRWRGQHIKSSMGEGAVYTVYARPAIGTDKEQIESEKSLLVDILNPCLNAGDPEREVV